MKKRYFLIFIILSFFIFAQTCFAEDCDNNVTLEETPLDNIEKAPVYFGDDKKVLSRGIGQYSGSMFIGSGSTVLLSGHNNTYLHTLGESKIGDKVLLSTNYGDYVYEITETAVKNSGDSTAFDLGADYENLVIYTCYPFDTLGLTSKRYFVYCKYVSGPKILYNK